MGLGSDLPFHACDSVFIRRILYLFSRLAIPFSLLLMIAIGVARINPGNQEKVDAYHERVAQVINSIPIDINGWTGQQVPLPQSAIKLLDPNALVARHYSNKEKNVAATLLIVQCRDTRDMAGHYPPRCYPSSGWMDSESNPTRMYTLGHFDIKRYGFQRIAGHVERGISVYSLFVLPTGEMTTSMREVRRLSANYDFRMYGAAQIQVVIDGEVPEEDHDWILSDMFEIALPAIRAVLEPAEGSNFSDTAKPTGGDDS
jgi:uncharacterized protein DUF3485